MSLKAYGSWVNCFAGSAFAALQTPVNCYFIGFIKSVDTESNKLSVMLHLGLVLHYICFGSSSWNFKLMGDLGGKTLQIVAIWRSTHLPLNWLEVPCSFWTPWLRVDHFETYFRFHSFDSKHVLKRWSPIGDPERHHFQQMFQEFSFFRYRSDFLYCCFWLWGQGRGRCCFTELDYSSHWLYVGCSIWMYSPGPDSAWSADTCQWGAIWISSSSCS